MPGFTLLRSALPIRRRTSFSRLFGDIFAYETNEIAQMKRIDGRDPFLQLVAEETVRPVLRRPEQIRLHYSPNSNKTNLLIEIASNPLAGDVIPGTGGLRKVRYSRQGTGKRGGVRVVHYNVLSDGMLVADCLQQSQI